MVEGQSCEELVDLLGSIFAPWVQALNIEPVEITSDGAIFTLPGSAELALDGNRICGQAIASMADTVCVLTLFAHNKDSRLVTTVDMNTQFLRPIPLGTIRAQTFIQSNGRRMANVRASFWPEGEGAKLSASAACTFAYI